MSKHHLRNKGSPEHRQSAKGILLGLEQKNRSRALSARVEELKTKLALRGTQDEIDGIKRGVGKFMKNNKPSRLETNLFDRTMSDDTNSGILLDHVQRTKDDVKAIPDYDSGGILDEAGESSNIPFATPQKDPDTGKPIIYGDPTVLDYTKGKLGDRLQKRTGQPFNKTSDILDRIQKGNPLQERIPMRKRIGKLQQKLAGFGLPPPRVIEAFRNGTAAETSKFKTDGKKLLFNGHEVARHKPGGIEVSYQGYNTSMTSATIRALGVDTRRTRGVTTINGKGVDPETKDFHFVPTANLSEGTFRVNPGAGTVTQKQVIDKQELFRKRVRKNLTGDATKIPLDPTAIQPQDQREINSITGVKSKIPRETKGVDTHHLLPKEHFPGLGTNANNGVGLSKKNHADLHGLNQKLFSGAKLAELKLKLRVAFEDEN
jgi:hypothetical protein